MLEKARFWVRSWKMPSWREWSMSSWMHVWRSQRWVWMGPSGWWNGWGLSSADLYWASEFRKLHPFSSTFLFPGIAYILDINLRPGSARELGDRERCLQRFRRSTAHGGCHCWQPVAVSNKNQSKGDFSVPGGENWWCYDIFSKINWMLSTGLDFWWWMTLSWNQCASRRRCNIRYLLIIGHCWL